MEKEIIKDLSDYIAEISKVTTSETKITNSKSSEIEITKAPFSDTYELSSAQKRIYYSTEMIGKDSIVYTTPGAILVDKILDKEKIENAFNTIIKNQSSFRTSFVIENGEIKQKISDNISIEIPT